MIQIMYFSLIWFMLSFTLIIMSFFLSKKSFYDREKSSPFECGFDPISNNHIPFSIHFFLISLIFLIFDIEIAILLPMIFLFSNINIYTFNTILMILILLLLSLYIEYSEKSIDWKL